MKIILVAFIVLFHTLEIFGQQGIDMHVMYSEEEMELVEHFNGHFDFAELEGGNDVFRWVTESYDGRYGERFFTILERRSTSEWYVFIVKSWEDNIVRAFTFYTSPKFVTIEEEGVHTLVITGDFIFH